MKDISEIAALSAIAFTWALLSAWAQGQLLP